MGDLRCFDIARQGEVDRVGDLRGQFVEIQRGDETEHRLPHAQAEVHEVGIAWHGGLAQAVNPLRLPDEFARPGHFVQDVFGHTQLNGCRGAQDAVVLGKDFSIIFHAGIIQQKYHTLCKVWYFSPLDFQVLLRQRTEVEAERDVAQDLFVGYAARDTSHFVHGVDDEGFV